MTSTVILWSCLTLLFLAAAVTTCISKWNSLKEKDTVVSFDGDSVIIQKEVKGEL